MYKNFRLLLLPFARTIAFFKKKSTAMPAIIEHRQLTVARTDREKPLRALYCSENALRALNNLTRLENRLRWGVGSVRVRLVRVRFG